MCNFMFFFAFCFAFTSLYAGEKEALQAAIGETQKSVALSAIREFHDAIKPAWAGFATELTAIAALPLETSEQIKIAQGRLAALRLAIGKTEIMKVVAVIAKGFDKNPNVAKEEAAMALAKLEAFKTAIGKADGEFGLIKIKLQLIGVVKQSHVSVGKNSVSLFVAAIETGTGQLTTWWINNKKSEAGLKKIQAVLEQVAKLKPAASSDDKRTLEATHMALAGLDYEIMAIFAQEP